jgi:hypothetical protein
MAEDTIRSLRPNRMILDGAQKYRGGQIQSIVGGTTTIKLLAEANIVRTKTCATSLVPADAQSIGCPVCCRLTGPDADNYVIAEVLGSTFADPPLNNAASVAKGEFRPGIVPRSLTGEPLTFWEG